MQRREVSVLKDLSALTVSANATLLQTIEAINVGAKQIALVVDADSNFSARLPTAMFAADCFAVLRSMPRLPK